MTFSRNHRRRFSIESLETRQMLAAVLGEVALEPMDVDRDGVIAPADALAVINVLNDGQPTIETDINGDGKTSPLDALMILNRLNIDSAVAEAAGSVSAMSMSGEVTFAMIGDYGSATPATHHVTDRIIEMAPDFIVAVGDARYGSATYDDANGRFCDYLSGVTAGPNCSTGGNSVPNRFFGAPGNHDYTDAGGITEYTDYFDFPGPGVTSPNPTGSELYYDVVQGPVHIFVLDSQAMLESTEQHQTQANWLRAGLESSGAAWQVVLVHHSPFSSGEGHGSNPEMQLPFATWGADLVLSGHDHSYERIERAGTTFVVNGLFSSKYAFGTPIEGSLVRYNDDLGAAFFSASETALTGSFMNNEGDLVDSFSVQQAPHMSGNTNVSVASVLGAVVGDFDANCIVDQADYDVWTSAYGSTTDLAADGNGNGIVDAADFTIWQDNVGNGICTTSAIWRLTNREYKTRDLHAAPNSNADLAVIGSSHTEWEVTAGPTGTTFRNVDSGEYLAVENFNAFLTPTIGANTRWNVIDNADGSVALQNIATGRYLDGDGASDNWDVDESTAILFDDGWVVTDLTPAGTGVVTGVVYSDTDSNGRRLTGPVFEPGIRGRTVWLDLDDDGLQEVGEPFAVTDADGVYLIDNAPNGSFRLRVATAAGWTTTTPSDPFITIGGRNVVFDFGQNSPSEPYVALNAEVKLLNRETLEYLYAERYLLTIIGPPDEFFCDTPFINNFATHPSAEVDPASLPDIVRVCGSFGTTWNVTTNANGTLLRNVEAHTYLVSPAPWTLQTSDPPLFPNAVFDAEDYWGIIRNVDGSIGFQNKVSGQYLDADSDGTIGMSQSLLSDDSWFVVY